MEFTYKNHKFVGDNVWIYVKDGVHLKVGSKQIVFKEWEEFREFMYKYEALYYDASITKQRQKYGKDMIFNYDKEEGIWTIFWRGQSIEVRPTMLRELQAIMRYFIKGYHKLMLDLHSGKLSNGFKVDTGNALYIGARGERT